MYSEISEVEFLSCLFCLHVITADNLKLHSSNQDLKASFQQILILIVFSGGRQKTNPMYVGMKRKLSLREYWLFFLEDVMANLLGKHYTEH